jgi:hypothetical protein
VMLWAFGAKVVLQLQVEIATVLWARKSTL